MGTPRVVSRDSGTSLVFEAETLPGDGHEHMNAGADPDLSLHGILAGTAKRLDRRRCLIHLTLPERALAALSSWLLARRWS